MRHRAPEAPFRRRYLEQELLELSAVAIPANPDALVLGVKSRAVERGDLRETVDLLREAVGGNEEADRRSAIQQTGQSALLDFARELHGIMRA